jgi:DNA mismatch repair protein MSH2
VAQKSAENLKPYSDLVETTVDLKELDKCVQLQCSTGVSDQTRHSHNYVIKAEYDTELGAIKERLTQVRDSLDEQHATVAAALGFETDNKVRASRLISVRLVTTSTAQTLHFEVNQVYGHCFRLTRKESSAIRGKKGYIELGNRNNGVFFTTSALRQLAQDFKDLTTKYERKQSSLVKEVISIAGASSHGGLVCE